uniref:C2H2-type domain-containing protein n=1 Tax=Lutzomyia longipalpis TaxID=7200 RepID=A0A1B0GKU2_LUTLO
MKKIDPKYRELNHLFDIIDNPDEDTELVVPTEEDINSQEFPSTQKGYLCRICFSTFTSFTLLNDHTTTTHFTEPKFHCRICMHSVAAESDLNEHLVEAHASDSFTNCPYCQKNFTVFSIEFERHLRNHNLYQNQVSRYGFRNTHRMFYICPNCWMLFWHREQYTQHMTFHSLPEGNDCELCGRKCGTEMELKSHMEKVHKSTKGQKRVALPCLPSSTRMKAEGQVGSITSCPYCNMKISHTMSFDSHLRFFHRGIPAKIPNGQIRCTVCKKVFSDLKALLGHVKYYEVNGNTHGRPKGKQTFTKCSACSKTSKPHLVALKNTKVTAKTKCTCGLKKK